MKAHSAGVFHPIPGGHQYVILMVLSKDLAQLCHRSPRGLTQGEVDRDSWGDSLLGKGLLGNGTRPFGQFFNAPLSSDNPVMLMFVCQHCWQLTGYL